MGEFLERGQGLGIGGISVFDAAEFLQLRVFGADSGIVEAGGYRVGEFDLAVVIGEQPGFGALQDAETATLEAGGVALRDDAVAAGFHADHADVRVIEERMKQADRVGTATDTGD